MPRMSDGAVVPSFMGISNRAASSPGGAMTMSDNSLRVGEVIAVRAPSDPLNVSGKENEYIVSASYRDGQGALVQAQYRCVLRDGLGTKGDHYRRSLRARDAEKDQKNIGDGAVVLIACINGDKGQAVIMDCLRNPNRTDPDPEGRFLDFEFNGVHISIDDAGMLTLEVLGPTDTDGEPEDEDAKKTTVTIDKAGAVTIETTDISIKAESATVEADDVTVDASNVEVDADHVTVKSPDVNLGDSSLDPSNGLVHGQGVDTFTGAPYFALGNTSKVVKGKK
jgi:phage baseplate assembly protein gpV